MQRVFQVLFGPARLLGLRERLYLALGLFGGTLFALVAIQNAALGLDPYLVLLTGGSSVTLFALYAIGRFTSPRLILIPVALGILYLNATLGWFTNGGSAGGTQYFWASALFISVFLVQDFWNRLGVACLYALSAVLVYVGEITAPELVATYPTVQDRQIDVALSLLISNLLNALIIGLVAASYDQITRLLRDAWARADRVLEVLLPPRVTEHLQTTGGFYAEDHPCVSVLFADMVGFSRRVRDAPSDVVVRELDQVFRALDTVTVAPGIEKIKTIGDAYMAVAGLAGTTAPAVTAVNTALAFIDATTDLTFLGEPVQLRIGIATGPITSGVIGVQRPHYDIWGDTVNLAARLEAHGEPNRVQVDSATQQRVLTTHRLTRAPDLQLAERPRQEAWFVEGRKRVQELGPDAINTRS